MRVIGKKEETFRVEIELLRSGEGIEKFSKIIDAINREFNKQFNVSKLLFENLRRKVIRLDI